MARSKESTKKDEPPPYREYMQLRSMSRRSPPPYSQVNDSVHTNSRGDCVSDVKGVKKVKQEEKKPDPPTIELRSGCDKFPRCRLISCCISALLTALVCYLLVTLLFPYPLHASCTVKWKFKDPCTYVMQKFRCQILNWSSNVNCGPRAGKCLYKLSEPKSDESNIIRATHTGLDMRTMETMKITFENMNRSCLATGESVSNDWFRVFDYGTNYCNLRNLVTGIGFEKSPRFFELTTNAICTQYNTETC
ncbi:uncharacterized protein LOC117217917 [Megalopta genalis]|uniref:uncharacterized protein LOC117217917 n=1 Tax=Megalopta genalis TaxID=115081 RepID=UPI003FCF2C7C